LICSDVLAGNLCFQTVLRNNLIPKISELLLLF